MKSGWIKTKLKDVCELVNGKAYKKDELLAKGKYRVLRVGNFFTNEHWYFSDLELEDKKYCDKGDLLYAWSASFGPRVWSGEKVIFHYHIWKVSPNSNLIDQKFLFYFLMWDVDKIKEDQGAGTTMLHVSKGSMDERDISIPSIHEQQRIVAMLDQAFEGIAKARANAEQNLQNTRALFESHLQSVFTQRGEGWVDKTLDQVCIVERGSSPRPIKDFFTTDADGVNWIKIGDTEEGGKYVYTTAQKITIEGAKQSRFVKEGDFILTNSMSYGRPYIMKISGYIHDGWFVLRLNEALDSDYFYYLLSSSFVQSQFTRLASGSVVKNISGDLVKMVNLPIPPIEHQHLIVKKLLGISSETQRLEALYQRKIELLDELKKSLLQQAFAGEL